MNQEIGLDSGKTALELALELGVRSETVLQVLRRLGLKADSAVSPIDGEMEEMIVDQMIADGLVPVRLAKGKGRRILSQEPLVDDDLLTEALGASEAGFSESRIPRQLLIESRFAEKPSFFGRFFHKKNDLARTLKESETTEEELRNLFAAPASRTPLVERSPFSKTDTPLVKKDFKVGIEEDVEDEIEYDVEDEITQPFREEEFEEENETEFEEEASSEEGEKEEDLEDLELDESLLEELDGVEIDEENLGNFDESELQELEDLDLEGFEGEEESDADEEGAEELDSEIEDLAEGEEEEEETPSTQEEEEEEVAAPSFIESILNRIQLSPVEMWTLMGGSVVTMLMVLIGTIYWWRNESPEAMVKLLEKANGHYDSATAYHEEGAGLSKEINSWQQAADTYEEYIQRFPENPSVLHAYRNLCDSYYRIATGYDAAGNREKSEEPFRKMAQLYESFLVYLDDLATKMIGVDPKYNYLTYPNSDDQRTSVLRIALAQSRLGRFDIAIEKLQNFVRRFRNNRNDVLSAMVDIGDTYQKWANVNTEQKPRLLNEAIKAYNEALGIVPEDDYEFRMKTNVGLGDIKYSLYQKGREEGNEEEATPHLLEAIAYYERANDAVHASGSVPIKIEDRHRVLKQLGDLYLIRGRESGKKWRDYEENAEPYPQVIEYKNDLLQAAAREHENANSYLGKATGLFDEILKDRTVVAPQMLHDIQYAKAESNFILKKYADAIAAGEQLLSDAGNLDVTMKAKINYLMGDAAWEQAKETEDYSNVKKYYRSALELDPFYPKEHGGDISHLAEIRLNNAYFLLDKKYEDAILRFDSIVKRFPDDDYTYLTRYYYAKALDEYGDVLFAQAQKKKEDLQTITGADDSPEIRELLEKAKNLQSKAEAQYEQAIRARDGSKYVDTKNKRYLIEMVFNQGQSAYKANKFLVAKQYLENALDEYRTNEVAQRFIPDAIERLGDINVRLYDFDNAIRYYQDYLKNGFVDEDARVNMKLADAYFKGLNHEKAREWYRKIMVDHPPLTAKEVERKRRLNLPVTVGPGFEALKKLANSYYRQAADFSGEDRTKMLQLALNHYNELADRFPSTLSEPSGAKIAADMEAQRMVGNIHYELGNYNDAAANYEAFLRSFPNYNRRGHIYHRIGKAYTEIGQYDRAFAALKNVTPDTLDNPIQYADALILLGQAYEAKAKIHLDRNEPLQYESYLERAEQAYERVAITNVKTKISEAMQYKRSIDRILQTRRELAKAGI
ncbi:MAG: hypothetical protein C4527_26205 [Candidatus Omnitrophota bacterium]|nr:MAG: hypothetical protein C4527_26205 [Candidatus Omnitrophota bacterium]